MASPVFPPTGGDWLFATKVFGLLGTTGVIVGERRVRLDAAPVFHR